MALRPCTCDASGSRRWPLLEVPARTIVPPPPPVAPSPSPCRRASFACGALLPSRELGATPLSEFALFVRSGARARHAGLLPVRAAPSHADRGLRRGVRATSDVETHGVRHSQPSQNIYQRVRESCYSHTRLRPVTNASSPTRFSDPGGLHGVWLKGHDTDDRGSAQFFDISQKYTHIRGPGG